MDVVKTKTIYILTAVQPGLRYYFVFSLQIICWLDLPRSGTPTFFSSSLHKKIVYKYLYLCSCVGSCAWVKMVTGIMLTIANWTGSFFESLTKWHDDTELILKKTLQLRNYQSERIFGITNGESTIQWIMLVYYLEYVAFMGEGTPEEKKGDF